MATDDNPQVEDTTNTSEGSGNNAGNSTPEMIPKHRYDKRNNEYQALKNEHEELKAKLEENKSLEDEFSQLKSQLQRERIDKELEKRLGNDTPVNPEAVKKLIDSSKISLDEDMQPSGVDEALEEVKTAYPELFTKPKTTGNVGTKQEPGNKKVTYSRGELKKMSLEEFNSKKTDIMKAYQEGRIKD